MLHVDLNNLPSTARYRGENEWADFIELSCLCSVDGEISAADIADRVSSEGLIGADVAANSLDERDRFALELQEYFEYMRNRAECLGSYYPFESVDNDTVRLLPQDERTKLYTFLLLASNTRCIDRSTASVATRQFERFSQHILQLILPLFTCEVFGTSSEPGDMFYGGTLLGRMEKLASSLNASLTNEARRNPAYKQTSGDDDLDIVAFLKIDPDQAEVSRVPLCLGQCKCSYEGWASSQGSVRVKNWSGKIRPISPAYELMFVPFPVRDCNGAWHAYHDSKMVATVIDRMRFIAIVSRYGKGDLSFFTKSDAYSIVGELI